RDASEGRGVVDEWGEEVDGEDDCAVVVELVDSGIVGRIKADEEVLRLGGDEAAQQLLEARRRVLRGAAAAHRQARERGCFHPVYCTRGGEGGARHGR